MGPGVRYGLLAALTLVLASALVWDRLHPAAPGRLLPRGDRADRDTVRIRVGGPRVAAAPPREAPGAVPGPAGPSLPGTPHAEVPVPGDGGSRPPETDTAPSEHTVAPGDTLGALALRYLGSSRRAAELAKANGMDLRSVLRVGAVLRIPADAVRADSPAAPVAANPPPASEPRAAGPPEPRRHTVQAGDSLSRIARRYYGPRGDYGPICDANGIDAAAVLRPGQVLAIP